MVLALNFNPQLSTVEIADMLTYVTNSSGNKNGVFSEQEVRKNLQQGPENLR